MKTACLSRKRRFHYHQAITTLPPCSQNPQPRLTPDRDCANGPTTRPRRSRHATTTHTSNACSTMKLPGRVFVAHLPFLSLCSTAATQISRACALSAERSQGSENSQGDERVCPDGAGRWVTRLKFHQLASRLISLLRQDPSFEIVPSSTDLFARAVRLYDQRPDKEWGLTDCSSFVVMQELNLKAVLSADHHFRQAGYQALLLDPPGNSN